MAALETDYLVVGGGAAGMAFVDSLIAESEADVVIVERRHRPGGHWNSAYPFVRLHQPSAFYGVNSRVLGSDSIDSTGPNAGLYEQATGQAICEYFHRVLEEHLVPSGRVRFLAMTDYEGDMHNHHRVASRLTGRSYDVVVRRRLVDARFLEASIPATHTPSFEVDDEVRLITINDLVDVADRGSGFTIVGAGKTAMDACLWLLDQAVDPNAIRWIRPRDAWLLDRQFQQPLTLLPAQIEGVSRSLEASAAAESPPDLFHRLENSGQLLRIDPRVTPTMYRCATVSGIELDALRRIEDVVRMGRVRQIGTDAVVLENGSVPTDRHQIHVDCSASGLPTPSPRPVFEPGRITLQQIRACQPTFSAALAGFVETTPTSDAERNRLCPANPYPSAADGWIPSTLVALRAQAAWSKSDVSSWLDRSRLNAARGIGEHKADPRVQSSLRQLFANMTPAIDNLSRLACEFESALPRKTPSDARVYARAPHGR
jgi:NAD(P)-binding Rossmann-like domain